MENYPGLLKCHFVIFGILIFGKLEWLLQKNIFGTGTSNLQVNFYSGVASHIWYFQLNRYFILHLIKAAYTKKVAYTKKFESLQFCERYPFLLEFFRSMKDWPKFLSNFKIIIWTFLFYKKNINAFFRKKANFFKISKGRYFLGIYRSI